jgi:hypothetical protein
MQHRIAIDKDPPIRYAEDGGVYEAVIDQLQDNGWFLVTFPE